VDAGDLVVMNTCGTTFAGYRVCMYQSFIWGRKPNAKDRDFYARCRDRVYGIIDRVKPGATTADAAAALQYSGISGGAIAAGGRSGSRHRHDIWRAGHQPDLVLRPSFEEMVLVTETGKRVLSNWPSEEIIPVVSVLG
jgi:hypothetical protein